MTQQYERRFSGIKRLYGSHALNKFNNSHFCVIGIGGVGSWVAESLTRTGIGKLTLIDMDDICTTNTNRQVHTNSKTIGMQKVNAMAERCRLINPEIEIVVIDDFINKQKCFDYLSDDMDYIFDAIDTIHDKVALIAHCKRNKYPLLTSGGAGGQIDPTQIQVTDLARTIHDPLASRARQELRRHYNFTKNPKRKFRIDCVFSTEQVRYPEIDGKAQKDTKKVVIDSEIENPKAFGASSIVTASFAFIGVSFMLKKMLSKEKTASLISNESA
ncbi:MAG TPA: tRNA cyclic N6-threonylcarbamoyladenosine(37) synthase TcdA [Psychromonas hadalis]|nr:tRNA cyclic N6-threonylcarbamoyladenosine(37) synthase TcdA [Psychromonas hadalis]